MTITIFGATGMVGKRLVALALAKGYCVTAFDRHIEELIDRDQRNEQLHAVKGYVFDTKDVYNALKNTDAVLSVLGTSIDSTDKTRSLGMKNIISQMEKAGVKRIVALGSIGIMSTDENQYVLDMPDYPQEWQHIGNEDLLAFHLLEKSSLDWTIICPHTLLNKDGSNHYTTSNTYTPAFNQTETCADDVADCMLTEITNHLHLYQRVGIFSS